MAQWQLDSYTDGFESQLPLSSAVGLWDSFSTCSIFYSHLFYENKNDGKKWGD